MFLRITGVLLVCDPVCMCVIAGILNMLLGALKCYILNRERESIQGKLLRHILSILFSC